MAEFRDTDWVIKHWGPPCRPELVEVQFVPGRRLRVDKRVAPFVVRLGNILENKAPVYARNIDEFYDDWVYACRDIGDTGVPSKHSWGIALDVDATKNGQGVPFRQSAIWRADGGPQAIRQAAKEGWYWGGRFSNPDPMHFEPSITPRTIWQRYHGLKSDKLGQPRDWYRAQLRGNPEWRELRRDFLRQAA